jgi:UDP-N-acetylglucosamine--N-acetylmuramyl-(pentapeptide) pyrophosphoryl-undecaprenol N-acetylglucosamine transferase
MNLADELVRLDPTVQITALGTTKGLDATLIPARGYPLELIPPVPLPRQLGRDLFATPGKLRAAVAVTSEILARVGADVVVGFGGYVAVPAYLAARQHDIPIVVHEANAKPGLANRGAARMTTHVFTGVTGRLPHATVIGIPLRPEISKLDRAAERDEARRRFGLDPELPALLVTGGSQGARSINWAASQAADGLRAAGVQVLHIIGPKNVLDVQPVPGGPPYVVLSYLQQMEHAYAAVDFALCRCGAMTCAELSAVGLPALYVPYPVGNGEQRFNAEPIVRAGGGILIEDAELTADRVLAEIVPRITDPDTLRTMSAAAAHAGSRDAATVLARHVLRVAAEHQHFAEGRKWNKPRTDR